MNTAKQTSITEQIQTKLNDGMEAAFESVLSSKNAYYQNNPSKIPSRSEVDALIRASVTQNAAISGGASLVPGPWGMLAVVPELLLVIRNQIGLIYDIGAAHGKKEIITRELLLGVFLSAAGTSAGSILVIKGSKVLVRRASLQVMQKVISALGGRLTQQALKSAVSKWLPGVGAVAMAAWSGYLTKQIGNMAIKIMEKEIETNDPDTPDIELIKDLSVAAPSDDGHAENVLEFCKLQVLVDLAKIDGHVSAQEQTFLDAALENPDLTAEQKTILLKSLDGTSQAIQGLELVAARPDSAIALVSNMIALARRDGEFHITEKIYIKKIGAMLGFEAAEMEEFIASA